MPYVMCPICGAVYHLNVTEAQAYAGSLSGGNDLDAEPCFHCWCELAPGDRVITRTWTTDEASIVAGQQGELISVTTNSEFGNIYNVKLDSGKSIAVPRGAVRKLRGGE